MRVRAILNPRAGVRARRTREAVEQGRPGWKDYAVYLTRAPGHATDLAGEAVAGGADVVLAVGGDGTVNEVARGILGSTAALGVVPVGSGNGLARALGLPLQPRRALAALEAGVVRTMDVGLLNGQPFLNVAGIGFDAAVGQSFQEHVRRGGRRGLLGYLNLGTFAVGDTTIQIKSGELLYTDIMLEYQHAVKDWLAFSLQLGGGGRLGTETSSLIAEGVSVASVFEVGWRMRLWQSDDMMLSGGLSVNDRSYTLVDLAGFIDRIIEDGGLRPGNTVVRSVPIFMTLAELQYAYGVSDLVGLVAEASFGYGESVKREASSEWYHTLGAAVDFDLNPCTSVPRLFLRR